MYLRIKSLKLYYLKEKFYGKMVNFKTGVTHSKFLI